MSGTALRVVLAAAGFALVAAAVVLAQAGCAALAWRAGVFGVILVVAGLVERWRYKRLAATRPGSGWIATGERFVDPESGKLVTVYFHPPSGERRYVTA